MTTKDKFVKLCELIYLSKNGFVFPFEDLDHDDDLNIIQSIDEYQLIVSKMNNFLQVLNSDHRNIDKDIELEIYDSI